MQNSTIKALLVLLKNQSRKSHILVIILLGGFSAFFDIAFVAILKEYIGFFTNEDSFFKTTYPIHITNLTILTAAVILISFSLKIINIFAIFVFSEKVRVNLSASLTKSIVSNSSREIERFGLNYYKKLIVNEVDRFSEKSIAPLINSTVQTMVLLGLFAYLLYLNIIATAIIISIVIFFYLTISFLVKNKLNQFSKDRLIYLNKRLDGIDGLIQLNDEIKEKNSLNFYLKKFFDQNKFYSKITIQNNTIAASPRFLLECFIFLLIVLSLFLLHMRGGGFVTYIPLISAFLLAFYKMIPSAQFLYNAYVLIQSNSDLIKKINDHLMPKIPEYENYGYSIENLLKVCSDMGIRFNGTVKNFNIVYGNSGIGKSTMLYNFYKGLNIKKAFVKQTISLIDGNIYENIRLGDNKIKDADIDKYLDIFELVDIERNKNLKILNDTISGGEKQRIAIIRALISKPRLLILDETLSGINRTLKSSILNYLQNSDVDYIFIISHDSNIIDSYNSLEVII